MLGDYFERNPNKICKKRVSNRLNREEKAIRDPVPAGLLTLCRHFLCQLKFL